MLEFINFPEHRLSPTDWKKLQPEVLETNPEETNYRALTDLPSGEMLLFDLREGDKGYPLRTAEQGWPEDSENLGLTIAEYLELANELAPLESRMHQGDYPYQEIVTAIESRGLQSIGVWSEFLEMLAESRDDTETRMRTIRGEGNQ